MSINAPPPVDDEFCSACYVKPEPAQYIPHNPDYTNAMVDKYTQTYAEDNQGCEEMYDSPRSESSGSTTSSNGLACCDDESCPVHYADPQLAQYVISYPGCINGPNDKNTQTSVKCYPACVHIYDAPRSESVGSTMSADAPPSCDGESPPCCDDESPPCCDDESPPCCDESPPCCNDESCSMDFSVPVHVHIILHPDYTDAPNDKSTQTTADFNHMCGDIFDAPRSESVGSLMSSDGPLSSDDEYHSADYADIGDEEYIPPYPDDTNAPNDKNTQTHTEYYLDPTDTDEAPRSDSVESQSSELMQCHAQEAQEGDNEVITGNIYPECTDCKVEATEYAELENMDQCAVVREHSAADTEAAHELLSLAGVLPPPAAMMTMLCAPEPVMPVYTYAVQPTGIYILGDEPSYPNMYGTAAVSPVNPLQQVEYMQPQMNNFVAYQDPITPQPTMDYQGYCPTDPLAETVPESFAVSTDVDTAMPVSVIEEAHDPNEIPIKYEPEDVLMEIVIETVADQGTSPSPPPVSTRPNKKRNKYDCIECGKRYATSSNLSRHKQTHRSLDSKAAKRCVECGKVYVSMPALAMHMATHRMGHVCAECGKHFSRPWLLRSHQRSHTGDRPYGCNACGKSFADRSNLRAHIQTHSLEKKWKCKRCHKTFAVKNYLNKHWEAFCSQDEQNML